MKAYRSIRAIIEDGELDALKAYKGNKEAMRRVRSRLQDIRFACKAYRDELLVMLKQKNS